MFYQVRTLSIALVISSSLLAAAQAQEVAYPEKCKAAGDMAAQGRVDEGLDLIRRVQENLRDKLGEGHSHTVACSVNHAVLLLHDIGSVHPDAATEARELLREAQARFTELNGQAHPFALICHANLAVAEAALGSWDEARRISVGSFEMLKEVLDPLHPSTLTCAGTEPPNG